MVEATKNKKKIKPPSHNIAPDITPAGDIKQIAKDAMLEIFGIQDAITTITNLVNMHKTNRVASGLGIKPPDQNMNIFLIGLSGTGKTSLAKAIAFTLKAEGIVNQKRPIRILDDVITESSEDDHTEEMQIKIQEILSHSKGGILILDEIDQTTEHLIFEEMKKLRKADKAPIIITTYNNAGSDDAWDIITTAEDSKTQERYPTIIAMPVLDKKILLLIWDKMVCDAGLKCSKPARVAIENVIGKSTRNNDYFTNGRTIEKLFRATWGNMCSRFQSSKKTNEDKKSLTTIEAQDIADISKEGLCVPSQTIVHQDNVVRLGPSRPPKNTDNVIPFPQKKP